MSELCAVLRVMQDQVPRLLPSIAACHYEVEWETEYACPVDSLVSHSCQLNIAEHGIYVDLSPLASGYYKLICDVFHLAVTIL